MILDYWTNTVSRTVLATLGLLITINLFKVLGEFIQCFISVDHIFSSITEDKALVDPLDVVGQVLLLVKGISTQTTGKCPFPNMLSFILLVQLPP